MKNKRIAISTHYLIYSAPTALRDYLKEKKIQRVFYFSHPLLVKDSPNDERSYCELIQNGQNVYIKKARFKFYNLVISSIYEFIQTIIWFFQDKSQYDLFVGVDCLNSFQGIILKLLGRVKKTVYYTIDYFPVRFKNPILNWVYFSLDRICVRLADETWNVSSVMVKARQANGLIGKEFERQFTVPIGVWFDRAPRKNYSQINKKTLIFVGHLKDYMGVDLAIKSLPKIIKTIPDIRLIIIGGGEQEEALKKLVNRLGLTASVNFYGWIRDRGKLENIMSECAVGIAPFNTQILDDKVKNADPAKIKDYMLLGMPVIITDAISTSNLISQKRCGFVIKYDIDEFVRATRKLLDNETLYKEYRQNSLDFVKQFDFNDLFKQNLKRVLTKKYGN